MADDDKVLDDMNPKEHYELGVSMGMYQSESQAIRAYEAGEIDLWVEYIRPKTFEGWKAWEQEHGEDFSDRWKQ